MLFDDQATLAELGELAAMLTPDVNPVLVTNLRRRSLYHAFTERRAEVFGTVILDLMESWSPLPVAVDAALLARLVATLHPAAAVTGQSPPPAALALLQHCWRTATGYTSLRPVGEHIATAVTVGRRRSTTSRTLSPCTRYASWRRCR